jgi:hypothetical protein
VGETLQVGLLSGNDEGGRLGVTRSGAEQTVRVGADEETDKEKTEDKEAERRD